MQPNQKSSGFYLASWGVEVEEFLLLKFVGVSTNFCPDRVWQVLTGDSSVTIEYFCLAQSA